jgi:hypothetical protein
MIQIKNNKKLNIIFILLLLISIFNCKKIDDKDEYCEYEDYENDIILENIKYEINNKTLSLVSDCQADDISLGLVGGCTCRSGINDCRKCNSQNTGLIVCNTVCGLDNRECHACDIWYGGVCECLQKYPLPDIGSGCFGSISWQGPTHGLPPVWILRNSANLISSTVLNTGIENINQMPDKNEGWLLGLSHINTATQALTMNSVETRSRNEIHIHLCNKNIAASNRLGTLDPKKYSIFTFIQVIGTSGWYCEATAKGTQLDPSSNFVKWLSTNPQVNINKLGIGLLTDTHNNYIWTCISTYGVAEQIFC